MLLYFLFPNDELFLEITDALETNIPTIYSAEIDLEEVFDLKKIVSTQNDMFYFPQNNLYLSFPTSERILGRELNKFFADIRSKGTRQEKLSIIPAINAFLASNGYVKYDLKDFEKALVYLKEPVTRKNQPLFLLGKSHVLDEARERMEQQNQRLSQQNA